MSEQLREKPNEERLELFRMLTSACTHLYSKGKFQEEKFNSLAPNFIKLAKGDPIFMAHLASWAMKKDSKDMQVMSVFFNALSDADGLPFFEGSERNKPNFRQASAAAIQLMAPHLALRVLELSRFKFSIPDYLSHGSHMPAFLSTAFRKYILYREINPNLVRGIKNSGLSKKYIKMYKLMHMAPTVETAGMLGWNQKGRKIVKETIDFTGMSSGEVCAEITHRGLGPIVAISALDDTQMNHDIARVLLERCTGNQAIILQNMFRTKGFLDIPEFKDLFGEKVKTAGTAIDRIDTLAKDLTDHEKKEMSKVRSTARKKRVGDIGKIFMHIDVSPSMGNAIEFAKECGSIIAECVNDPANNFAWSGFDRGLVRLRKPEGFLKEDFYEALYGVVCDGWGTNCVATYASARDFGADVDIYLTDQAHNTGSIVDRIQKFHDSNPEIPRPKASIIINFESGGYLNDDLEKAFETLNMPFSMIKPETVTESALVAQAVANAIKGQIALVEEILDVPILQLPKWYWDNALEQDYKERLNS